MTEPANQFDRKRAVMTMVLLNGFSMPMMLSAVNVALPAIARDLEMDAVLLSWVPMAFLMASAALVLSFGRVADMYGRKRLYLIGTGCLILSSILATTATSGPMLIMFRLLQGICAAMIYGTHIAIVSSVYPPAERGRMIGLTVSIIYIGLTCGPLIGGWFVERFGWEAAFLLHVPLCSAALVVGLIWVKGEWQSEHAGRFDPTGAALYVVAIVALMFGISSLPSLLGFCAIILGALGFWAFFHHQHGRRDPLFDVSLFYTNRVFTLSCLASLIIYTATFANVVMVSLYLQYLKGMTADAAGLVLMVQPLVIALVSPAAGRWSDRLEPRIIASLGMTVTAIGLVCLATLNADSAVALVVVYLMLTGLGFSLFSSPNANAIMGSLDKQHYGIAGSSVATMRVLGQMSSMGIVALAFALTIGAEQITPVLYPELSQALTLSFCISAALCLPGIYFSLARGRLHVQSA